MPDTDPDKQEAPVIPAEQAQTVCLRCKTTGPVSDDGFCNKCEQLMEQACL
jgi:hypothetical protein